MRKDLFDITGMSCSACSTRIEKVVSKMEGVSSISVNLLKNNAHVEYDEAVVDSDAICARVEKIGYAMKLHTDVATAKKEKPVDTAALEMQEILGEGNFYLELQDHGIRDQTIVNKALLQLHKETGIPLVCTNDAHYLRREDSAMQDYKKKIAKTTQQDAAAPVAGYDLVHAYSCNRPKAWMLECSSNGLDWVTADVQTAAAASAPNSSYTGFRTSTANRSTCAFKLPLTYAVDGATGIAGTIGVGVDAGATLDFSRMTGPIEVDRLVIDAAKGFGSLANVVLADTGTIEVMNVEGDITTCNFPMTLKAVTGVENLANWTLVVNGVPQSRRTPDFKAGDGGGTLFFRCPGLVIMVK